MVISGKGQKRPKLFLIPIFSKDLVSVFLVTIFVSV
jgi:hypothetical protein